MALHKNFPKDPHVVLDPEIRWFPADEALREEGLKKLLPPLVTQIRKEVKEWRDSGYKGASKTSRALLNFWFQQEHLIPKNDGTTVKFEYYFAQREAVESVIYLYEVAGVRTKHDLLRYDSSGYVSAGLFDEDWPRFVIKMATGSGKTKVLALLLAWSFFHKTYEKDSELARNFLLITPNIIVLDRIRTDFDGLKVFNEDPMVPENGFQGKNWQDDFQLTVHIQDEVNVVRKTGNIFLTNIHRVFEKKDKVPKASDDDTTEYFLGDRPVTKTTESKVDLGEIVRDVDELMILNDEAHHIHDPRMAWFKSIQDIHNRMKMKGGQLPLQLDVTATPKSQKGAIFPQTIADYPLVEAIHQNVVKHPVIPDEASQGKLQEKQSAKFSEKYKDYIHLAYIEWKKVYKEHEKLGKKAILFVMTDDTKNCDEVGEYLRRTYQELQGAVLVIHTKDNGEISEAGSGKSEEELKLLRKDANTIDDLDNKYKAIVSVMMLREGWDVKNVTTILGLKALNSPNKILPEQALGRGLRMMYRGQGFKEKVSAIGSEGFMSFIQAITREGVELEKEAMGERTKPKAPLVVEIDKEDKEKDIESLDIEIPVLTPRIYREYKNLSNLDVSKFRHKKIDLKEFSESEKKEIAFKDIVTGEITHLTELDTDFVPNYQSVLTYFTQNIMRDLRLTSGQDILYGKVKVFVKKYLFKNEVNIEDLNILRNLSEIEAVRTIQETFRQEINKLTILDKGEAEISSTIKVSKTRPFIMKDREYLVPKKSIFNRIVGDSHFELDFAAFLESCDDVLSYVKNYLALNFRLDYKDADGEISNYVPDFVVKVNKAEMYVIETKGREDLDDPLKIKRLAQWCDDINKAQPKYKFGWLLIKQDEFEKYRPKNFEGLRVNFSKK